MFYKAREEARLLASFETIELTEHSIYNIKLKIESYPLNKVITIKT